MKRGPRLLATRILSAPDGVALVLHGGANRPGNPAVRLTQPSVLRMIPIASRIAHAGRGRLAVFRLLNSSRGWDNRQTPVMDARWALRRLARRYGSGTPVCLVGHSLGARAALLAGEEPTVIAVVALNPWLYATDDADLSGRRILIVHGTDDRVAAPGTSRMVARRLAARADVRFVAIKGASHAMLRHGKTFERLAADFTVSMLLGDHQPRPAGRHGPWRNGRGNRRASRHPPDGLP